MKQILFKWLQVLIAMGACVNHAPAAEPKLTVIPLYQRHVVSAARAQSQGAESRYNVAIRVLLLNSGDQPLRVPTAQGGIGTHQRSDSENKRSFTVMWVLRSSAFAGLPLIPAESALAITELLPGEAAAFEVTALIPHEIEPDSVVFRYSVDSKLADRFKLWSGVATATLEAEATFLAKRQSEAEMSKGDRRAN